MAVHSSRGWRGRTGLVLGGLLMLAGCGGGDGAAGGASAGELPLMVPGEVLRLTDALDRGIVSGRRSLKQRLLGDETYPDLVGRARIFVGKEQRDTLYVHAPGSFRIRVSPASGSSLRFGAAVVQGFPPVTFRVAVTPVGDSGEQEASVVDQVEVEPADGWTDRRLDLSPWAGKAVILELSNQGGARGAVALWGNPRIIGPRGEGPNIILYLIDTLRADHLGAYGYGRDTSPRFDRLAREGTLFERCLAHDSRTLGSIPSLLTSLSLPAHGVGIFGRALGDDTATLQMVLRAAGFQTASFITNVSAGTLPRLDRGFDTLYDAIKTYRDREALRTFPAAAFFRWLDGNRDTRFFAYVHTAEPHRPYTPPPPLDTMFDPSYSGRVTGFFEGEHGYGQATEPRDVDHVKALYDGEIRLADQGLGHLLDGLAERGLLDNTIIAITADHGEEFLDHGSWNHGQSLYEELLRVPLLLVAPPDVPAGHLIRETVQLLDLAPTLLELSGVEVPPAFEGDSLVRLMQGREVERFQHRTLVAVTSKEPVKQALIRGPWKCIVGPEGDRELYNLESDPGETENLADTHPEIASAMEARLQSWIRDRAQVGTESIAGDLDEEALERLRTLGYIK